MSKHTKVEWKLHGMEANVIVGVDHITIADVNARNRSKEKNQANAEFIIRACNNHYQLLECLKEINRTATIWRGTKYREGILLEKCQQVITNAEGGL